MATLQMHHDDVRPVYDSMKDCANHLGIPLVALQSAKRNGCTAFRNGRVYIAEFIRWLFQESPEQQTQDWADYEKKFKALTAEVVYHQKKELVVDRQQAKEVITKLVLTLTQALDRLESEMPTALEGRDRIFIRKELERVNGESIKRLTEEAKRI